LNAYGRYTSPYTAPQEEVMGQQATLRRCPPRELLVFIVGGSTYEVGVRSTGCCGAVGWAAGIHAWCALHRVLWCCGLGGWHSLSGTRAIEVRQVSRSD